MPERHIILLPKVDYFKWVHAAQKYALTFGVNITPDPQKAASMDVVTVAVPEKGFPEEGDITIWLKARYPNCTVDAVIVETPDELKRVLDERANNNYRFGEKDAGGNQKALPKFPLNRLYLFWPTDFPTITQPFAANPEIYSKWGLHGHEGLDFRAPLGANVYACSDGEVVMIENNPAAHAYGKHVRIEHVNGYKTVYGHLGEVHVTLGQQVKAREMIGTSDPDVSFLHLTLKKAGLTEKGDTNYPGNILDPTPFMVYPHQEEEVLEALGLDFQSFPTYSYPWARPCLVGVNGRIGGTMQEVDFSIMNTAAIEAIKLPENTPDRTIDRLRQMAPDLFIMARLSPRLDDLMLNPADWLKAMQPEATRLYNLGVRFFEINQSPNLQLYGLGLGWGSGGEFAEWWLEVSEGLREGAPEGRFGFPGLSPGGQVPGHRLDHKVFLDQADQALLEADWIGVNCYWSDSEEMNSPDAGQLYRFYRERFPEKLLFITEFGNVNQLTDPYVKGQEYVQYYQSLRDQPGIAGAFAQVISAASGYSSLSWRSEDGKQNKIPYFVGHRHI